MHTIYAEALLAWTVIDVTVWHSNHPENHLHPRDALLLRD